MALASTSPDPPSPLKNLDTLYPLACMLVGDEGAPTLLVRVYEQVADAPPDERPDNLDDWLVWLLREAPEDGLRTNDPTVSDASSPSGTDSLRDEVAERLVRNSLPVVLATCSAAERFFLALSASRSSESAHFPRLTDIVEEPLPADPSALLRDKLRTVLSAPEADLLDETLSDADLEEALREVLQERFAPVPSSLRARLRATLRSTSSTLSDEENADPETTPDSSDRTSGSVLDRLPSRPRPRALLFVLVLGALVLAGGLGVSYLTGTSSPPSSPPPSLVAFSAEQTGAVTTELTTSQPDEAEAYLDSTWDRQVRLPTIDRAQLQGVGRLQAAGDTEIPVVLYADADEGSRIAAFVYSYALVDRLENTTTLDTQIRAQLAQRNHLVADEQTSATGLLWRDRATIFVVVSPSLSPDTLRARVQP